MMQIRIAGACFLTIALIFTGGRLGFFDLSPTAFASLVLISIGVTMIVRREQGDRDAG